MKPLTTWLMLAIFSTILPYLSAGCFAYSTLSHCNAKVYCSYYDMKYRNITSTKKKHYRNFV